MHKKTHWRPKPGLDEKHGHEAWTHTGPHEINDGEVDGDIEFDDEVLGIHADDTDDEEHE